MNAIDIGKFFILLAIVFTYMPAWAARDFASIDVEQQSQTEIKSVEATASELIVDALQFIGVKYKYGGKNPETGFDCSGFVSHVFRESAGVALPPNAARMALLGQTIESVDLEPGDLVFYKTKRHAFSHVGIYLGDNKFIHAPRKGKSVEISDMNDAYWAKRFEGARRVADWAAFPGVHDSEKVARSRPGDENADARTFLSSR